MKTRLFAMLLGTLAACQMAWSAGPDGSGATMEKTQLRTMQYRQRTRAETLAWQRDLRAKLEKLLKLDDLIAVARIPFDAKEVSRWEDDAFTLKKMTIRSTAAREIEVVLTVPTQGKGPFPAVVCIGGHGSNKFTTYTNGKAFGKRPADASDDSPLYKGFAAELARRGHVTISTSVSQHAVREPGRTLMGERLWDLMRCVDYLESLPQVDRKRIGCAGLSLGGEMAMWLGAMDVRIRAIVSAGFLTRMDQMEQGHCMCWKFPGLRELVDFADVYALIAPRSLQCQNGRKEVTGGFTPALAEEAMREIKPAYAAFGKPDNASLHVHDGAHEVDLPALLEFFRAHS